MPRILTKYKCGRCGFTESPEDGRKPFGWVTSVLLLIETDPQHFDCVDLCPGCAYSLQEIHNDFINASSTDENEIAMAHIKLADTDDVDLDELFGESDGLPVEYCGDGIYRAQLRSDDRSATDA